MSINVTTITVAQFQAQFYRDFPYLNIWNNSTVYNAGTEVYDPGSNLFYCALVNSIPAGNEPVNNPAQWQQICDNVNNYVQTQDIQNAFNQAQVNFNPGLYCNDNAITLAYLYLTAHYLCIDLRMASQGVNSQGQFPVASKSAGSVSESYDIPDVYKESPLISMFTQTGYGMKFLSLTLPNLIGNMQAVWGGALP